MRQVMLTAPVTVQASLPPSPLTARAARDVIRPLLPEIPEQVFESLQLILSELVTNAVRHGPRSPVQLAVTLDHGVVNGEVRNRRGASVPRLRQPGPHLDGGLGLVLLDRLSSRWGTSADDEVVVWFEVESGSDPGHFRAG
jgi:anti-sigma regulatory factor (Ser/Thr protein kinase)